MATFKTSERFSPSLAQYRTSRDLVDWPAFFRCFEAIALVANSAATDLDQHVGACPPNTLFIFFNDVTRVIRDRFDRHAVLVARSGLNGSAIVRKNKIDGLVNRFDPERFQGVINLRTLAIEQFDPPESLVAFTFARLDLIEFFARTYPAGKTPSSGFAVAVWLQTMALERTIFIIGFTGMRTERRRVFDSHDWTFEQTALRLMARKGRLIVQARDHLAAEDGLARIQETIPDASLEEIAMVAAEVLSDRVNNLSHFIDRLWTVTRVSRWISAALAFVTGRTQDRR
ncbi:MAG: 3-deoxy-manno-octulosonate cytidylyltransferase [Pseudaminobacter sp.]|nr:3-deoxy-manno-octulosonate cytidylyltransferase [Pseudaminobacter sp.]